MTSASKPIVEDLSSPPFGANILLKTFFIHVELRNRQTFQPDPNVLELIATACFGLVTTFLLVVNLPLPNSVITLLIFFWALVFIILNNLSDRHISSCTTTNKSNFVTTIDFDVFNSVIRKHRTCSQ